MESIYNILFKIRAALNRIVSPSKFYYLFDNKVRTVDPISEKFGFDRGTPVDRFWIESFLAENKQYIHGRVLEITDSKYTNMFGGDKVKRSDVLDINSNNKKANIIADLRKIGDKIKDNSYDCIILTHVLGLIDDYPAAIKECKRILKQSGTLLFTGSCLGPVLENNDVYWRFTENSVEYIFNKYFKPSKMIIRSKGNALAGQAFWVGMSQEDLEPKELEYNDPRFPCVVTAVISK